MHTASVTFNHGSHRETGYDESFPSTEEAISWIEHTTRGHQFVRAWIDGNEVPLHSCGDMPGATYGEKLLAAMNMAGAV